MNPRMERVYGLSEPGRFTLNLGSGETSAGDVTCDIDPGNSPDLVADAASLPLKDSSFEQVIFADVLEHIPVGTESKAVSEIYRILKPGGILVLSTPNDRPVFTLLDPAHHLSGHRHYAPAKVKAMVEGCGFQTVTAFTAGGMFACVENFFVMGTSSSKNINRGFLEGLVKKEYATKSDKGYTVFLVSKKGRKAA